MKGDTPPAAHSCVHVRAHSIGAIESNKKRNASQSGEYGSEALGLEFGASPRGSSLATPS